MSHKCEGDKGCDRWASAKGTTYEEKLSACKTCPQNCTPPPPPDLVTEPDDNEVTDLVDEIEYIITWQDAGIATDWSAYTFDHQKLAVIWRAAEKQVERLQNSRMQAYLLSKFKNPGI